MENRKKELIEAMIKKTEDDLILLELDSEFYNRQGILDKDLRGVAQLKDKQIGHLKNYIKFLREKNAKTTKSSDGPGPKVD